MRSKAYIQNKTKIAMRCTQKTIKPAVRLRCVQINRKCLCCKTKEETYPFCLAIDSRRSVMAGREDTGWRKHKARLSERIQRFPWHETSALKQPQLLTDSCVCSYLNTCISKHYLHSKLERNNLYGGRETFSAVQRENGFLPQVEFRYGQ